MIFALTMLADTKTNSGSGLVALLPILLIGVVFYLLLIRPQQRRARAQRELIQSIDEGDEIVTIGGLFGVVREVDDESVLLEVAPGIELRFLRSAVARKLVVTEDMEFDEAEGDSDSDTDEGAGERR
ncbi:MAG TPA: preprotein translocase subunit YajC [Actinomycetota bacterium]